MGNELRTRNTGMVTFLSPCAAATTLQQLRRDIESMKLTFGENRVRMENRSSCMLKSEGVNLLEDDRMDEC